MVYPNAQGDGAHCLDYEDDTHPGFNNLIRNALGDLDLFEIVETGLTRTNTPGLHTIYVEFTVEDAAGRLVRHSATGTVESETCQAKLPSIN